jgi:F0F1-type ATP synthase assembly protein I
MAKDRTDPLDDRENPGDEPEDGGGVLPDRVEDLPGWREPPAPPPIPSELQKQIHRPKVPGDAQHPRVDMSDTARALGMGINFVATVMVGALAGWGLSFWLGHMAAYVLGGIAVGLVAAFVRVVRATQAAERREAEERRSARR